MENLGHSPELGTKIFESDNPYREDFADSSSAASDLLVHKSIDPFKAIKAKQQQKFKHIMARSTERNEQLLHDGSQSGCWLLFHTKMGGFFSHGRSPSRYLRLVSAHDAHGAFQHFRGPVGLLAASPHGRTQWLDD